MLIVTLLWTGIFFPLILPVGFALLFVKRIIYFDLCWMFVGMTSAALILGLLLLRTFTSDWQFLHVGRFLAVPTFVSTCAFVVLFLPDVRRAFRLAHQHGKCLKCEYDLRGISGRCPECGEPIPRRTVRF